MTDTTSMKHQDLNSSVLRRENDETFVSPICEGGGRVENVLSVHAAQMTWKLCKEECLDAAEMPKEVTLAVVQRLLA